MHPITISPPGLGFHVTFFPFPLTSLTSCPNQKANWFGEFDKDLPMHFRRSPRVGRRVCELGMKYSLGKTSTAYFPWLIRQKPAWTVRADSNWTRFGVRDSCSPQSLPPTQETLRGTGDLKGINNFFWLRQLWHETNWQHSSRDAGWEQQGGRDAEDSSRRAARWSGRAKQGSSGLLVIPLHEGMTPSVVHFKWLHASRSGKHFEHNDWTELSENEGSGFKSSAKKVVD